MFYIFFTSIYFKLSKTQIWFELYKNWFYNAGRPNIQTFYKQILLHNQIALIEHFAQKHALKITYKHWNLKKIIKLLHIRNISAMFSCFAFLSTKFAQIIKYFVQLCDCMIAAFRNSANIQF